MRMAHVVSAALLCSAGAVAQADTLVAARTLRAGSIIAEGDVALAGDDRPLLLAPEAAVGLETRIAIYEGRPVPAGALGAPTLVARNQTVLLRYARGGIVIETAGRALDRGAEGDAIRALNLASRATVTGTILADGTVTVPAQPPTE